jgi:glycosyltransferase involved in cell wall biosynthesis
MRIAAIGMFKNEADIAYATVISMAEEGVDVIIIADNMSTDNTLDELYKAKEILKDSHCHVEILEDNEVGYYQSKKMTTLAHKAKKEHWCDWIIPFDADELIFSHTDSVSNTIKQLDEKVNVINMDLYNHFPTAIDPVDIIPFKSIVWRQKEKGALPKVAMKYHKDMIIEAGNHSVTYPLPLVSSNCLEIRHFPYRTWEQFKNKAINGSKVCEVAGLPKDTCAHWKSYAELIAKWGDEVVRREVFDKYFNLFSPIDNGMILDPAPFRRWNK